MIKLEEIHIVYKIGSSTHYPNANRPNLLGELIDGWICHISPDELINEMKFYYSYITSNAWLNAATAPPGPSLLKNGHLPATLKDQEGLYKLAFWGQNHPDSSQEYRVDTFEQLVKTLKGTRKVTIVPFGEPKEKTLKPIDPSLFKF